MPQFACVGTPRPSIRRSAFGLLLTSLALCACSTSVTLSQALRSNIRQSGFTVEELRGPGLNGMDGPYATLYALRLHGADAHEVRTTLLSDLQQRGLCRVDRAASKCTSPIHAVLVLATREYLARFSNAAVVDDINVEQLRSHGDSYFDLVVRYE